jgi:hypothetical protein
VEDGFVAESERVTSFERFGKKTREGRAARFQSMKKRQQFFFFFSHAAVVVAQQLQAAICLCTKNQGLAC